MLKGAIAEAKAASAAEKEIARAKIENNIARDGEVYFAQTYTNLKDAGWPSKQEHSLAMQALMHLANQPAT